MRKRDVPSWSRVISIKTARRTECDKQHQRRGQNVPWRMMSTQMLQRLSSNDQRLSLGGRRRRRYETSISLSLSVMRRAGVGFEVTARVSDCMPLVLTGADDLFESFSMSLVNVCFDSLTIASSDLPCNRSDDYNSIASRKRERGKKVNLFHRLSPRKRTLCDPHVCTNDRWMKCHDIGNNDNMTQRISPFLSYLQHQRFSWSRMFDDDDEVEEMSVKDWTASGNAHQSCSTHSSLIYAMPGDNGVFSLSVNSSSLLEAKKEGVDHPSRSSSEWHPLCSSLLIHLCKLNKKTRSGGWRWVWSVNTKKREKNIGFPSICSVSIWNRMSFLRHPAWSLTWRSARVCVCVCVYIYMHQGKVKEHCLR